MASLPQLKEMALDYSREMHPDLPEYARYIKPYSDKTANELTRAVIDFLKYKGHQAERVSVTGRYIDNTKVITDTLGFKKKIGSGKWIKSSMQPGTSDISATIKDKNGIGISVKIEIKIGGDRQSEAQKQYQKGVEMAGGKYWLVRSFDEFMKYYNELR
jgi:hypothetical protein